jgi:hypothetical protein
VYFVVFRTVLARIHDVYTVELIMESRSLSMYSGIVAVNMTSGIPMPRNSNSSATFGHQLCAVTARWHSSMRILSYDDPNEEDPGMGTKFSAMGWYVGFYLGHRILYHDGAVPGFTTCMAFIPPKKLGFIFLSNSDQFSYVSEALQYHILDDILQKPMHQREDWNKCMLNEHQKWEQREQGKPRDPYPNRASSQLSTSVGMEAYTGRFTNLVYGTLVVKIREGA